MEISSCLQEDEGRFAARTLSDISIASNASGKAQNLSSFGAPKHVRDTRVKFLCSHGGKILPRPSDKRLRYVGGETRMISVPRHIQLIALRLKLAEVYGHDVAFKYQLPEEDLDALVSVSSDEDLENMMEECDRLDAMEGSSRLRVFVFSSLDHDAIDFNDVADPKVSEHRYVEAVNTMQVDVSGRQNDNVVSPDFSKNSLGLPSSYFWNTAVMQERLPLSSENLHPQVYLFEQLAPAGNYPAPTLPQRNNLLGHVAPPPRIAVTKQRNDLSLSLHATNNSSHGPSVTMDDFFDLESGESASSSASSQHDLSHRSRWNSNTQIQSHLEHIAYRMDEDQMLRSDTRGQHEVLIDSKMHTPLADPFLSPSEQMYCLNSTTEDKNPVHEDQPLSPGALLQRQLQADQNHVETDSTRPFQKQGSQSSLDGNVLQPTEAFSLSHERQQIEQFPFHHPAMAIIQEGILTGGHLLSETLNVPDKVHPLPEGSCIPLFANSDASARAVQLEVAEKAAVLLPQVKPQEASLYPTVLSHVEYTQSPHNDGGDLKLVSGLVHQPFVESPSLSGLQTITTDINRRCGLDGLKQHVLPSTNDCTEQSPMNGLDFGIQSRAAWLPENLVSFPPRENSQVDVLDQLRDQSEVMNASGVTANQFVAAGLSLLDEPVCYNEKLSSAAVPDVKVELSSAAIRECSPLDMMSHTLPSAPLINCYSSSMDTLVATLLDPLANPTKDEIRLPIVTDAISGLSLDKASDFVSELSLDGVSDHVELGLSHGTESAKQPAYQENVVFLNIDDVIVGKEGAAVCAEAKQSSFTLHREAQNKAEVQLEHDQLLHVNHERDAVEIESSMVMERDLALESSRLETEEEDVFSSTVDRPMNAAAIAEAEAIARGLQTIRNFDLEELKELGSGTFGTVYHGKWRGTDVAIKRIKSSCFTGRPSERERLIADFWQEAYILGQLHHPNVVAFYGVVPDGPDGTLATVTEYMVNGSLKQALQKKERSLDRRKRLIIAMDAAFGMEYLHKKNVVHFDLKCENLLVNLRDIQRPICKVGDLGLSKVKQQTMISGGVRGTLPWMAPELLNGSSSLVSEKVDVFSFGIVLWELLTGEEPYASMHYGAIIGGIVTNTLRPPVPRWCDAAWRSLMEACWAADPAERPTFTEIANSLRAMEANLNAKAQGQAQNVE